MLYPTPADWTAWNIPDELHQFFTLHWDELFDDDTPDTWQLRTCNVQIVLDEIIAAAQTAQRIDAYRNVLSDLVTEALSIADRDPVIDARFPFVSDYLQPWKRVPATHELSSLRHAAQVLKGNLTEYSSAATSVVRSVLSAADPKTKLRLYDATMSLAVDVAAKGYSTEHIQEVFRSTIATPSQSSFLDRFDTMMAALNGTSQSFQCTFLVQGLQKQITNVALPDDISAHQGPAQAPTSDVERDFYKRGYTNEVNVTVTGEAVDPITARYAAAQRLNDLFAALNLYGVEEVYRVKVDDALVRKSSGTFQIVPPTEARLGYLRNAKGIHWKAENLLKAHSRLHITHRDDAAQLIASLHYHRLAMSSTSDEARLVNLWVALESLCQEGEGSIIHRVCSKTAPCVASGNPRKVLTNLAIYVRFFWDDTNFSDFQTLFPNASRSASRSRLPIGDLLAVLLKDSNSPDVTKLFDLVATHPLIRHRLFRVKSRLLDSSLSVSKSMVSHARNIDWQLRRIYRVRNAIVHRGRTVPYLRQLIQHLHSYLVIVLQSLTYELTQHPDWGIEDALEHRRLLHERATDILKAGDPTSITSLLDVGNFLKPQGAPFSWPTPEGGSQS